MLTLWSFTPEFIEEKYPCAFSASVGPFNNSSNAAFAVPGVLSIVRSTEKTFVQSMAPGFNVLLPKYTNILSVNGFLNFTGIVTISILVRAAELNIVIEPVSVFGSI